MALQFQYMLLFIISISVELPVPEEMCGTGTSDPHAEGVEWTHSEDGPGQAETVGLAETIHEWVVWGNEGGLHIEHEEINGYVFMLSQKNNGPKTMVGEIERTVENFLNIYYIMKDIFQLLLIRPVVWKGKCALSK